MSYDIANTFLNAARVRLNDELDVLDPLGGGLLENTQPWTQQAFNNAYRKLQEFLADLGFERFIDETIVPNFPSVVGAPAPDFSIQVSLPLSGLPSNFIQPRRMWERPSGTTGAFKDMDRMLNGLPSVPKQQWMLSWEWRNDAIYMPGALIPTDLRIRFAAFLPDIVDVGQTPWFQQLVPIERCQDPMTDYICREVYIARGNGDAAATFQASAEDGARKMCARDMQQEMAVLKASEYGKMADVRTPVK